MANFFSDYWKTLKLDVSVFEKIRYDKSGLLFASKLFLFVSLTIFIGTFAAALAAGPKGIASRLENSASQLEQYSANLSPAFANMLESMQTRLNEITTSLDKYQPPLGRNVSYTIRALGQWINTPLTFLGVWMAAGLAVFLVAKILKGQGDLREHINVFLLGFAPQILLLVSSFSFINSFVGVTGSLLSIAAFLWSLVIVIKGLNLVHGFGNIKSLSVLILTFVFFGVLLPALTMTPVIIGLFTLILKSQV